MVTHITDLHSILDSKMEITSHNSFMLIYDDGPDFKLDLLSVFTYTARCSAFNPIENLWSVMSNKLSVAVFSPTIERENKPPVKQSGLSKDKDMNVRKP